MDNMKLFLNNIKGDKGIWMFIIVICIWSFLPIYSSSSNLAYKYAGGSTFVFLSKHFLIIISGILFTWVGHHIKPNILKKAPSIPLLISLILLLYTLLQNKTIGGANASRWLTVPFIGLSYQPSTIANITLMIYLAKFLSKRKGRYDGFRKSLWGPIFIMLVTLLTLPSNLSTSIMTFSMCIVVMLVGKYPVKYILGISGIMIFLCIGFYSLAKVFPDFMPNRVTTWENRIHRFFSSDKRINDDSKNSKKGMLQVESAKTAIAIGGILGKGPGKSAQKYYLPQSSSDFIFAIIVEEYGMIIGGILIIIFYLFFLFRIILIIQKTEDFYGKILAFFYEYAYYFSSIYQYGSSCKLVACYRPAPPLYKQWRNIYMDKLRRHRNYIEHK